MPVETLPPVVDWIAISAVFLLIFISRSVYSWIRWEVGRDAYAHMHLALDIKNNDHRLPEKPSQSVVSGVYGYPYLMHWVLSFVPKRYLELLDKYFSGIMDVLFSLIIVFLIPAGLLTSEQVLLSLTLFFAAPEFVRPNVSHGTGMSGRKPGLILTTLSLLCFTLWLTTGWIVYAGLSSIFGATVFLTSKFGLQAYLFISVGLAFFTSPNSLVIFVVSFLLAITISAGNYLIVLKGHLQHLYDYATSKQFKISNTKPQINIPRLSEINSLRDILEAIYKNKILFPIFNHPVMIALVVGLVLLSFSSTSTGLSETYLVWITSAIGAFVLTSLPYMRFLGQAERYLEYAFLPATIYVSVAWTNLGGTYSIFLSLMIVFGMATILTYYWAYRSIFTGDKEEETAIQEVIDFLDDKQSGTILIQPVWKSRRISWETGHKIIDSILHGATTSESAEEMGLLFPEEYGFVTSDLDWLAQKYDPDWLIIDVLREDEYRENNLKTPSITPDYENGFYKVYRFGRLTG